MEDTPGNSKRRRTRPAKKPLPPLLSILETAPKPEREKFPVFLGVGIAMSVAALVFVTTLSFCSSRKKPAPPAVPQSPAPAPERKNPQ